LGVFFSVAVVPGMAAMFDDFEMDLPIQTRVLLSMSDGGPYALLGTLLAVLALWLLLWLSTDFAELRSILKATPLVGPIARWAALARFARLLALLLENRLTMPDGLRLAGVGSRDGELSAACRRAAEQVEAGQSLRESLGGSPAFPKSLGPIADWGERARALPEALRTAAEMFEGRLQGQLVYLRMIVPPLTFLIVLWGVMFLVAALMLPMVNLIEKLT
jgi:type II secretory pathway component PulF